jgi:hypothetical protein
VHYDSFRMTRSAKRSRVGMVAREGNAQTSSGFVWHYVSFHLTFLASAIFLMVLGCATNRSVSTGEDRVWRAQLERQQQAVREAGRIGYIGYEGPASR